MYEIHVKVSSLIPTRHLTFPVIPFSLITFHLVQNIFAWRKRLSWPWRGKNCLNVKTIRENVGGWSCQSRYFWKCPWLWRWTRRRPEHLYWHVWNRLNLKALETNAGADETAWVLLMQLRSVNWINGIENRSDMNYRHNSYVIWLQLKNLQSNFLTN